MVVVSKVATWSNERNCKTNRNQSQTVNWTIDLQQHYSPRGIVLNNFPLCTMVHKTRTCRCPNHNHDHHCCRRTCNLVRIAARSPCSYRTYRADNCGNDRLRFEKIEKNITVTCRTLISSNVCTSSIAAARRWHWRWTDTARHALQLASFRPGAVATLGACAINLVTDCTAHVRSVTRKIHAPVVRVHSRAHNVFWATGRCERCRQAVDVAFELHLVHGWRCCCLIDRCRASTNIIANGCVVLITILFLLSQDS